MYQLRYADGTAQALPGRVALTKQDNDLTKPATIQASFTTTVQLPDDVATHVRLGLPQVGTSRSTAPYQGQAVTLEAGGVEVMPNARLALDKYTSRTGYTGKLLGGNRAFYDLLVKADGTDKLLRDLDLSAFDHDWTLAAVAAGAAHRSYTDGYVYDLYDRGLGVPTVPSRLYEAGYWPTTYARAAWEAIFLGAGVKWSGQLPAVFDTALLPAAVPYGYSDQSRDAHRVVAGYAATDLDRRYSDEQDDALPFTSTVATKRDTALVQGSEAVYDPLTRTVPITVAGYYDLRADQDVHLYCSNLYGGEVSAVVQLFVNGQLVGNVDSIRGSGQQDASLTALAERQLLVPGDVVQARYKFDKWKTLPPVGIPIAVYPLEYGWVLQPVGRLSVELLDSFPPSGRVRLADWLPSEMTQRDFIKFWVQLYGLTQTTDPYTGNVLFRHTAAVVADPRRTGVDWSQRRDGSQPVERSWQLGSLARRNWFRWRDDDSTVAYQQAVFEREHNGLGWNDGAAKAQAAAFAAGCLDNGPSDVSLPATQDVLTLPFAATTVGADGLLLVPRWKPKLGADYAADLATIQEALDRGPDNDGYTPQEAALQRTKALGDDFDTQQPQPRLVYQHPTNSRLVTLLDDAGQSQQVALPVSYFLDAAQAEDLDFSRSLLPRYYPHLAAALARPLVLRAYMYLSAVELVAFDQLVPVWLSEEQSFFYVNKVDQWESDAPSTAVELIRL